MWPRTRIPNTEQPRDLMSISDPAFAAYFQVGPGNWSGVNVSEESALGIAAFWRACSLISETIASLPLNTYREIDAETRQKVASFLDDPGEPVDLTPFSWKETIILHLLLHGRAPLIHLSNAGGGLIGLMPVHPLLCQVDPPRFTEDGRRLPKTFGVTLANGKRKTFTNGVDMTEILGKSLDGWYGMSVLSYARNSLGTQIAGDRAAANLFNNGFLQRGLVTPKDDDVDEDEAKDIKAGLDDKTGGWEHAGEVAFVNRKLEFTPWTMTAEDAQFLQSRQFGIEEISRWTGVPPHLLMQTEKQTSWGTGVAEQNRGLSRFTLLGWTERTEQALSRRLSSPRFAEFDFARLERPTPEQEIDLLIKQAGGPILTVNEARAVRNLPPVPGGDVLRAPQGVAAPAPQGEPQEALT
jgi:HK97 family phage portal protein